LIVATIGISGSGKTTALEYLISHFSGEGYSVGAIKHIHHENFSIDKEGTNTWRYAQAGSKVVVGISPHEIDIIKKTERELKDFDRIIGLLQNERLDIIFIEGFHALISKRQEVVKIITAKEKDDLERTLQGTTGPIIAITGLVAKNIDEPNFGEIPMVKMPQEGIKLIGLLKKEFKE
jgi:molybdopterin-guanine dinucleotide biosynthesis adapter protein